MVKKNEIKCEFTSIWDDGSIITTPCTYNPKTGEVTSEVSEAWIPSGSLIREFITLPDGDEIEVCQTCHEFVLKTVMNPIEEQVCSNPNCGDEG